MSDKVIRFKKDSTQVFNNIIRNSKDVELIGLYTIIQHCLDLQENTRGTDNEFTVSKKGIQSYTGYSDSKFNRIWDKLKKSGYFKQIKVANKKSGTYEYVYELLEDPNKKIYHSLVQRKDKLVANIPKNKLEKMVKESDELTQKIANYNPGEHIENTDVDSHKIKKPQGGKVGGYNNIRNKKIVCMYLERTSQYFDLLDSHEMLISKFKENISFELFEVLLNETVNKNKHIEYFLGAVKRQIEKGVFSLEQYKIHKEKFNQSIVNTKKAFKYVQVSDRSYDSQGTNSNKSTYKKTGFHNFDETYCSLPDYELDSLIESKFGI